MDSCTEIMPLLPPSPLPTRRRRPSPLSPSSPPPRSHCRRRRRYHRCQRRRRRRHHRRRHHCRRRGHRRHRCRLCRHRCRLRPPPPQVLSPRYSPALATAATNLAANRPRRHRCPRQNRRCTRRQCYRRCLAAAATLARPLAAATPRRCLAPSPSPPATARPRRAQCWPPRCHCCRYRKGGVITVAIAAAVATAVASFSACARSDSARSRLARMATAPSRGVSRAQFSVRANGRVRRPRTLSDPHGVWGIGHDVHAMGSAAASLVSVPMR